jgi:cardiolipin synthase A/B
MAHTRQSVTARLRARTAADAAAPVVDFVRRHRWWHTALIVTGVVAILSVIGALFFTVEGTPERLVTDAPIPPVGSPAFTVALSHLVNAPVEEGGTVRILNDGDEFLPALLDALEAARHTIHLSVYIWTDGTFSDRVLDVLLRQQQRGVAVRVLLDALGARGAPGDRFDALERAGGRVERFRTPRFGRLTRFHRRSHRRAIVVDGQVGFTGGMAIYDKWLGRAQDPDHWRDVMFEVTGPPARRLQAAFADAWASSSGEMLVGPGVYPALDDPAPGIERFVNKVWSPSDDDHSMAHFFLLPLLAARHSIYIATPYFIPDHHLKHTLQEQARRGIDVRLLLPGPHMENRTARWSAQNHYDDLIEAGVRVYEYAPTYLHSKFIVVDRQWSIVGSPNLNSRSRRLDEENALGILDDELGNGLADVFFADLQRAEEIDLDRWRHRGPFLRLLQRVSQLLDRQS